MKNNVLLILFLVSLLHTGTKCFSQISNTDRVFNSFDEQLEIFPQEKIHLHTDRDVYVSGEKIWFKAYVVDAQSHISLAPSRYVYVELISPVDTLIHRVMVREVDGMFYGNLPLTEYVPTGNYTLRAYTRYMENLGDDYFFKKNIRIENFSTEKGNVGSRENRGAGRNRNVGANLVFAQKDFDVSFFPEGGNLVEGEVNKVAFKTLNKAGFAETISGDIIDEAGSIITSIKTVHAGMGAFSYIPQQGKRYFLKCRNGNGLEKRFELPKPNPRAYSLTVSRQNEFLTVGVQKSSNSPVIPCYLLAHCQGMVFYFDATKGIEERVRNDIAFPVKDLPAGILQFVLFDEQMNPLSERLVFSKNYDIAKVEFHTDSEIYKTRDHVISSLSLIDSDGYYLDGHLSIAITDDKDIAVDSTSTILSSLLLSSELKGYIENPAWYLSDNDESATALDLLMMTHGWRRYNVPEVVKGKFESPKFPFQTGQDISGKVKTLFRSKSVIESEVIILTKDGDYGIISTDENGAFRFYDCEYPDSTSFFIQALNKKGSNRVELFMEKESFPKLIHAIQTPNLTSTISKIEEAKIEPKPNDFILKAEQRSNYDEGMRMIYLSEVVVTARKNENKDEARLSYWANFGSDKTIRLEDINIIKPRMVSDILRTVSGVWVFPDGGVYIRGYQNGLPLVLIDGVPVDWGEWYISHTPNASPLEQINVNLVESIDVFKSASSSIFGARGAAGVISITTKRGGSIEPLKMDFNYTVYTPLGYQNPVEFYSPKYDTLEAKKSTIPDYRTTIFWKPDIVISDTGETSFDFYTSDFPTTYSVVIEGLTNDGKIVRQVERIRVE